MKAKLPFIVSLILFLLFSWKLILDNGQTADADRHSLDIRLRNAGHQLLLKAGDSTSRVLPVAKLSENEYMIQFENNLFIEPDTLVKIVKTSLHGMENQASYVVNVTGCAAEKVVYGFEIFGDTERDVVPCLGRSLPADCYQIRVVFSWEKWPMNQLVLFGLSLAACVAFGLIVFSQRRDSVEMESNGSFITIGQLRFYPNKQFLQMGNETIDLTAKENHVLKILASHSNGIINRDQLQKEVWEDDGVLVGRSLDVFISRLRKKLEADPGVRIVNIHGKGYKLEV